MTESSLTLYQVRAYLQQQSSPVFMWHLTQHFRCTAEAIMPLLKRWINKGNIVCSYHQPCKGCQQQCKNCQLVGFQWVIKTSTVHN